MHAGHAAYLAAQANEMVERVNGIGAHAITLWSRVLPHSLNGNKIGRDGMRTLAAALRHCTQLQRLGYVRPARLTSPVTLPVSWLLSVRFWSSRPTIDRSCTPIVSRAALSGALSHTCQARASACASRACRELTGPYIGGPIHRTRTVGTTLTEWDGTTSAMMACAPWPPVSNVSPS